MAIEIHITDHNLQALRHAKISETATVARLIPALVTQLELPTTDPSGRPVTYHLSHGERQLEEDQTLTSAGVQSGDTLTIVPEMTAGIGFGICAALSAEEPPILAMSEAAECRPRSGFPSFAGISVEDRQVRLYVHEQALGEIREHSITSCDREVGGILTGEVYEEDGKYVVLIESICRARHVRSSPVSLQFTAETWIDILKSRHTEPQKRSLGWYHSHPGIGVFLSGIDEFTHQSFFSSQPWYVAVVIDPISGEFGAFTWEHGRLCRCTQIGTL
ncbi:MAG TPA: EsaB/YukD family protein [Pyrinomonadaceae bacterium]|nr:EsaB/YukD family protein [Pyrinomonadaceae bacterium]